MKPTSNPSYPLSATDSPAILRRGKFMIFLDMDGVVADFAQWALKHIGPHWMEELEKEGWGEFSQHPDLYAQLPPCEGARELFEALWLALGEEAPNRVQILTALSHRAHRQFPRAVPDKIEWARRHLHPDLRVGFGPYAVDKQLHVRHPHDVLIDDMAINIKQWNAAGGIGILHTSPQETLLALKKLGIL